MGIQWVRLFRDGSAAERSLLGGKGANLAEMTRLGVPVPPGFTITTHACRLTIARDGRVPDGLWREVEAALVDIEAAVGRGFGDPQRPLLLSVRSGAEVSMPGMMETILNVGATDAALDGLTARLGPRTARDCRRRLIQMLGRTVFGVEGDAFEQSIATVKRELGVIGDEELDASALDELIERFGTIVSERGHALPDDPEAQLRLAVTAVFDSWRTPRAVAYRRAHGIADDLGTAVTVQAMVFGNGGPDCATGVAFTRDPNTGAPGLFGEYLTNAQGEDVVAGVRTPLPIAAMADDPLLAPAAVALDQTAVRLERHFRDVQDLEFTIESGDLWLLQSRAAKRTATAAVRHALDMSAERLIDRATAVRRVRPERLDELLLPRIDEGTEPPVLAVGLPASPGAATGRVVFDPLEAVRRGGAGEAVILVRQETSAEDFAGMVQARGLLTVRGGMTSHAAVVARGMGKPAVTGCAEIEIDVEAGAFQMGNQVVRVGDEITLDGATGRVMRGRARVIETGLDRGARCLLRWADDLRDLRVRANADTPEDTTRARDFGAEGIGLCRTEHMFFGEGRIDAMRAMILAESAAERTAALAEVEALQRADFAAIFRAMDGFPVTIRTLDPPLHEFLPRTSDELERLALRLGRSSASVAARVESFHETNPMLGHRGCRLGITFPEITEMQARAILAAAIECAGEGVDVRPEVMIPFVSDPDELRLQRQTVDLTAESLFAETGDRVAYRVGTMIELPRAALLADRIAEHADFLSFGTNDLTQTVFGLSRDDAGRFLPAYIEQGIFTADPFQTLDRKGVGRLIEIGAGLARQAKPEITIGLCGEHGGDPASIAFCHALGMAYVSCSPYRVPVARMAAAHAALEEHARAPRPPVQIVVSSPARALVAAGANYLD